MTKIVNPGMPSGRMTDINNTIASAHGLPSYADANTIKGGTWDIGVDEYSGSFQDGGFEQIPSLWTLHTKTVINREPSSTPISPSSEVAA